VEDKSGEVTRLLHKLRQGNCLVEEQLIPIVYNRLKRNSANRQRPTALVHEAYSRLTKLQEIDWQSRSHFFWISAAMMRRISVDHARAQQARKRGDGAAQETLDLELIAEGVPPIVVLAIDEVLTRLATFDKR
jgi:hypothetical protein